MREPDAFYRWIMPSAPSCPEPVADVHILSAARAFCMATRCWRERDTIDVTGDDDEIVCVPPYATLFEIEAASFNGRLLERTTFADARVSDVGEPEQITQVQQNSIALGPRGGCGGKLAISMFLMPAQNAQVLPDFLYEQYGEVIGDGALSSLLALPEQPFSNLNLAAVHASRFQTAKDRNFNVSVRGQQRAPMRTRSRYF